MSSDRSTQELEGLLRRLEADPFDGATLAELLVRLERILGSRLAPPPAPKSSLWGRIFRPRFEAVDDPRIDPCLAFLSSIPGNLALQAFFLENPSDPLAQRFHLRPAGIEVLPRPRFGLEGFREAGRILEVGGVLVDAYTRLPLRYRRLEDGAELCLVTPEDPSRRPFLLDRYPLNQASVRRALAQKPWSRPGLGIQEFFSGAPAQVDRTPAEGEELGSFLSRIPGSYPSPEDLWIAARATCSSASNPNFFGLVGIYEGFEWTNQRRMGESLMREKSYSTFTRFGIEDGEVRRELREVRTSRDPAPPGSLFRRKHSPFG